MSENPQNETVQTLVQLSHAKKSFGNTKVLKDISLSVNKGEVLSIIGPSGGGKSTLLRCCTLLETLDSGSLSFGDIQVAQDKDGKSVYASKDTLRAARQKFGLVFQNFNLFPHYTVMKNIVDAPINVQKVPKEQAYETARALLEKMGLSGKENMVPCELSGGQQQRVAIARALANNPRIMLCDEATSALDTRTTMSVLNLLAKINKELGVTLVVITHSLAVARHICDRVAVIDGGVIVEEGPTRQVLENPQSDAARELVSFDSLEVK